MFLDPRVLNEPPVDRFLAMAVKVIDILRAQLHARVTPHNLAVARGPRTANPFQPISFQVRGLNYSICREKIVASVPWGLNSRGCLHGTDSACAARQMMTLRRSRGLAALFVSLIVMNACSLPPDEPTTSTAEAIIGGGSRRNRQGCRRHPDHQAQSNAVYLVQRGRRLAARLSLRPATALIQRKIDPGSTLTISSWATPSFTEAHRHLPVRSLTIKETHAVPGFSLDTVQSNGHDLGVAITERPLPVTPLTMNRAPLDGSAVGQTVRLVGFGDSTALNPLTAGTRHDISLFRWREWTRTSVWEEGEAGSSCEGDSGGATFLSRSGQDVVIGVHAASVGSPPCTGANYDTRVDLKAASFVDPFILANDGLGDAGSSDGEVRRRRRRGCECLLLWRPPRKAVADAKAWVADEARGRRCGASPSFCSYSVAAPWPGFVTRPSRAQGTWRNAKLGPRDTPPLA